MMTSKCLNQKLLAAFPELERPYRDQTEWQEGDDTGSHVVYGDVGHGRRLRHRCRGHDRDREHCVGPSGGRRGEAAAWRGISEDLGRL